MTPATVPVLPRGVRRHRDRVRGADVLLGPETALMLDAVGAAVLAEVDGRRSLGEIATLLANRYEAPVDEVASDVAEFLADLAAKRLVDLQTTERTHG